MAKVTEKKYECDHFKIIKEKDGFTTIERVNDTIYYYIYDNNELIRLKIPIEDFITMVTKGEK